MGVDIAATPDCSPCSGCLTSCLLPSAQPPPAPTGQGMPLEPSFLYRTGWLQPAEAVPADGGPWRAGAAGAARPGWAGKPGRGLLPLGRRAEVLG